MVRVNHKPIQEVRWRKEAARMLRCIWVMVRVNHNPMQKVGWRKEATRMLRHVWVMVRVNHNHNPIQEVG